MPSSSNDEPEKKPAVQNQVFEVDRPTYDLAFYLVLANPGGAQYGEPITFARPEMVGIPPRPQHIATTYKLKKPVVIRPNAKTH